MSNSVFLTHRAQEEKGRCLSFLRVITVYQVEVWCTGYWLVLLLGRLEANYLEIISITFGYCSFVHCNLPSLGRGLLLQ